MKQSVSHRGTTSFTPGNTSFQSMEQKKERPSQNALAYFIIMFYREELIACAMDLNSSSDNFSFGLRTTYPIPSGWESNECVREELPVR